MSDRHEKAEESVGRNTFFSLLTQMTTALGTAVLTIYLVRALGPAQFGVLAIAVSLSGLVLLPSDFGITQSTSRFIAEQRENMPRVAAVMAEGLRLKLLVSAVFSVILFALAGPIAAAYGEPSLDWPIRWISLAVFFQSVMGYYRYAYASLRRISTGFKIVASESAAETGLSIVIVVLGGGAAGAAAGRAAGYAFGVFVAVLLTVRAFGLPAVRGGDTAGVGRKRLMKYAGALLVIDTAFALSAQLAPLMIAGFLGATAVGIFQAPARLIVFLQYPALAVANAVTPTLARTATGEPDVRTFETAIRHIVVFQALLMAPVIVWAEPIVNLLLGDGYGRAEGVLRALAPFIFFSGLGPLLGMGLNYLGEARRRLPIALVDVVLDVTLTAVLLWQVGLLGAAYATDVTAAIYVGLQIWVIRRMLGMSLRGVVLAALRGLLAAGAMALVLLAFGTSDLSVFEWIGGAVGGFAAFAAVLLITRQVTLGELRSLGAFVRRRLPGGRG